MSKYKRYVLYDDLRKVGEYHSLNEVYNTGMIRSNKTYFYHVFAMEHFYMKDNIFVFDKNDICARCYFYGNQISRRARLCPDPVKTIQILERTLKDISGIELLF